MTQLLEDLKVVRKSGVAIDREEHTVGICAAGVALRDPLGNYVAISVPVPAQRFYDRQNSIAKSLLGAKQLLEETLNVAAA